MAALRAALAAALLAAAAAADGNRTFEVRDDRFWKDGEPLALRSGSLHYSRVPPAYWRDRVRRMKALGLNSITTYVPWNFHEAAEGQFVFSGARDIVRFLELAEDEGMVVILRPGPYICAEWEMGGFPAWLLAKDGIRLRTYEAQYIAALDRWLGELLPRVRPYMYSLGGPVVMLQIENEYGSFGDCASNPDDARYMIHLLDLATAHLGDTGVVFNTVDGGQHGPGPVRRGSPWQGDGRVLATVDGDLADDYGAAFEVQRGFNAPGRSPKMWTELWVGWYTAWGHHQANKSAAEVGRRMAAMVRANASFSLYMAHGGSNFGFWSGANGNAEEYYPDVTSYDYVAPIGEAGDHNVGSDGGDLFAAIRDAIAEKYGPPEADLAALPRRAYGAIDLSEAAPLFDSVEALASVSRLVPDGEALPRTEGLGPGCYYGLLLYRRETPSDGSPLPAVDLEFLPGTLHDRAQVFVDGEEVGTAYRPLCPETVSLNAGGSSLDILVENMGRVNFGHFVNDSKGLLGQPPMGGAWRLQCLPLRTDQVQALPFNESRSQQRGPVFLRGALRIDGEPQDTYLNTEGLTKGYVWVNGELLGRHWAAVGPQQALFAPAPFLRQGDNEVIVLELHGAPASPRVASVAEQTWLLNVHHQRRPPPEMSGARAAWPRLAALALAALGRQLGSCLGGR